MFRFSTNVSVFYKCLGALHLYRIFIGFLQMFRCSAPWMNSCYNFYKCFRALHPIRIDILIPTNVSAFCILYELIFLFLQMRRYSVHNVISPFSLQIFRSQSPKKQRNNSQKAAEQRNLCRNNKPFSIKLQSSETFVECRAAKPW